jgi:hypothetical protein
MLLGIGAAIAAMFAALRGRSGSSSTPTPPASTPEPLQPIVLSTAYTAHLIGPARSPSSIGAIVLHSTEGDTAAGAAGWFANVASKGSAHVVIDDASGYRTVPDLRVAYGAHPFNQTGLHLEIVGYAKWSREQWLQRDLRLRRAARIVAAWCRAYGVPPVLLDAHAVALAKGAARGIVTHADAVKGSGSGSHWDPGPGFPIERFMGYVMDELQEVPNV